MQFPGHATVIGKSIWDIHLADGPSNYDFHFEMGGVETLHFWWGATTIRMAQIRYGAARGDK